VERTSDQQYQLRQLQAGHGIGAMRGEAYARYRRNCQMVFQNNFSSLSPRHLVKEIVGHPLRVHSGLSGNALEERVVELLERVGLGSEHLYRYPHQFSGGQRQRIAVARAIALEPALIVLDEPTSALDVSVQAQILNLLCELQQELGLTYLLISHDLNVVRHVSDRIVVMYVGRVCEVGSPERLFNDPRHPYTRALLDANPSLTEERSEGTVRLVGVVPDPADPPEGCRFHTRCPVATSRCGWEVQDVLRELERNWADLHEALVDVRRRSPFEAELAFRTPEAADEVARLLRSEGVDPMRGAITSLQVGGKTVTLGFDTAQDVKLERVGEDRYAACVLSRDPSAISGSRAGRP
ncbi:MAG: hypothetical protein A2Y74_03340, partial [Actinobacteria bacterium RBG_13_63_9]